MDDFLLKTLTVVWLVGIVFAFVALRVYYKVRKDEFDATDALLLYGLIILIVVWPLTLIIIPIAVMFEKTADIIAGLIKGGNDE